MRDRNFEIRKIEPRIANFVKDRKMLILRDKKTGNGLNVSHTEEGLTFTSNDLGKPIYYENGRFMKIIDVERSKKEGRKVVTNIVIDSSDGLPLRKSNRVYVEEFVPMDRPTLRGQIAECTWIDKAYRLSHLDAATFEV